MIIISFPRQLFLMCLTRSLRDQVKAQKAKWDRHPRPRREEDREYRNNRRDPEQGYRNQGFHNMDKY